jgi:hypothetical protein
MSIQNNCSILLLSGTTDLREAMSTSVSAARGWFSKPKQVCQNLVGEDGGSLLMGGEAVEQAFAQCTLKLN